MRNTYQRDNRRSSWGILIFLCFHAVIATAQVGAVLWEDNFDSLDTTVWNPIDGNGCEVGLCGWGNWELQYYRPDNIGIEAVPGEPGNNALVLEARRETFGTNAFTSGKVDTQKNLSVHYGLIEVRMRVPQVETGLWPAAWLLGTANLVWPAKGEIDMMEMGHSVAQREFQGFFNADINSYVGANAIFANSDGSVGSIAYDADYNEPYLANTSLADRFVTYRLYWEPTQMRFTVVDQGVEYDMYGGPMPIDPNGVTGVFSKPFYMLLNLAVGGNFTDAIVNSQVNAPLPSKVYIDYVRVSQWNGHGTVTRDYASELVAENGTFGVFTETTPTQNRLSYGIDADIFVWGETLQTGTTAAAEGSEVLSWETVAGNSWFGGGISALYGRDMSGYEAEGSLKFKIKVPADVPFRIGITDNFTNEAWVDFPAGVDQYGLTRDGEWGQVEIPFSDFSGLIAFQDIGYLFAIGSMEDVLPTTTFEVAVDDIVWEQNSEGGVVTNVPTTGVSLSPSNSLLELGETQQLTATVSPGNATNQSVNWTSSNPDVASVNANGVVTPIAVGTTMIMGTTVDGGFTDSTAVAVVEAITTTIEATGVSISLANATLELGQTVLITATVTPINATNTEVIWTSSNPSVVSVSQDGLVSANASGSATITAATADGGFTVSSLVSVPEDTSDIVFVPDPNKLYYIYNPQHDLRIGASGTEDPFTAPTSNTSDQVKWKFTASPTNNYYYIDCVGGGEKPRLRTDRSTFTDMQRTTSTGSWVRWSITPSGQNSTYFLTTLGNTLNRLQIDNYGVPKMVTSAATGTWEQFIITEATATTTGVDQNTEVTQGTTLRIQAEDYDAMSGVQTEDTTDDHGGLNVGYIDAGDWMEYEFTVPNAGTYTLNFRVASSPGSAAAQIQVNGVVLGTINIAPTGGWQSWVTLSTDVVLSAGTQTVRLYSPAQGWNINWLEIEDLGGAKRSPVDVARSQSDQPLVYPVPANEVLHIKVENYENYLSFEVVDITGKVILQQQGISTNTTALDVSELAKGVYFLRGTKRDATQTLNQFLK